MAAQQKASAVLVNTLQGRFDRATSEATRIATRHQRQASTPRTRDTSARSGCVGSAGSSAEAAHDTTVGDPNRCQKETAILLLFLWVVWAIVGVIPGMPEHWSFAGTDFPGNSLGKAMFVLAAISLVSVAFCGAMAYCTHKNASDAAIQQVPSFAARPDGTHSVQFANNSAPESRAARPRILQLRQEAPLQSDASTPTATQYSTYVQGGAGGVLAVAGAGVSCESHV